MACSSLVVRTQKTWTQFLQELHAQYEWFPYRKPTPLFIAGYG